MSATQNPTGNNVAVKSKNLVIKRLIYAFIGIVSFFLIIIFWPESSKRSGKSGNASKKEIQAEVYPTSGKEIATMDKPIKAYLDPLKTYTRIIGAGNAKYVLVSDPSRFFICNEKPGVDSGHIQEFWAMPAENYLIYPEGIDKIVFKWWI